MMKAVEQNENIEALSNKINNEKTKTVERCTSTEDKSRVPLACKTNQLQVQKPVEKTKSSIKQFAMTFGDFTTTTSHSLARGHQQQQPTFSIFSDAAVESSVSCASSGAGRPGGLSAAGVSVGTQTERPGGSAATGAITAADLCDEAPPGEPYWRRLAESRRQALHETLAENEQLHEQLARLQQEKQLLQQALQHAEDIVESVKEWAAEQERH